MLAQAWFFSISHDKIHQVLLVTPQHINKSEPAAMIVGKSKH